MKTIQADNRPQLGAQARILTISLFSVVLLLLSFIYINNSYGTELGNSIHPDTDFQIFDATSFSDKPDLRVFGIKRLTIAYENDLWPENHDREEPNEHTVRQYARAVRSVTDILCIDIERWPLHGVPDDVVSKNIQKLTKIAAWIHDEAPSIRLGFYGIIPIRNYWAPVGKSKRKTRDWQIANKRLTVLADSVEFIFPSLYTFYNDPISWKEYAEANLIAARKYDKPVYAFLWPRFHNSNIMYGKAFIPPFFWRLQLRTAYEHSDGLVIWDGSKERWDADAPWWHETKLFIQDNTLPPSIITD